MSHLHTDFLFAMPSVVSGVARLVDLFGVFDSYNESRTPEEADARAMYADWYMAGKDLRDSLDRFAKTEGRHQQGELFNGA